MNETPSLIDRPKQKLRKTQRLQLIPTLQIAGMTQEQIAAQLGVSRSTIVTDLNDLHPLAVDATDKLKSLVDEIANVLPIKDRAEKYAKLATSAKNEAVSLGALQRIDDLDGIVTEKERIRAKRETQPEHQPMFALPPGAFVQVINTQVNATIASSQVLNNDAVEVKPNDCNGD
jgi:transcriptional regulator with XRE-family HTH domain